MAEVEEDDGGEEIDAITAELGLDPYTTDTLRRLGESEGFGTLIEACRRIATEELVKTGCTPETAKECVARW